MNRKISFFKANHEHILKKNYYRFFFSILLSFFFRSKNENKNVYLYVQTQYMTYVHVVVRMCSEEKLYRRK